MLYSISIAMQFCVVIELKRWRRMLQWLRDVAPSCIFLCILYFLFVRRINLIEFWWYFQLVKCLPVIHVYDTFSPSIPKKMQFILRSSRTTLHFRMIIDNNSFSFVPTYSCRGSYVWRDSRLRANNPQDYSRKGFLHCCCASTWATISSSSPLNEHERRQTLRWT